MAIKVGDRLPDGTLQEFVEKETPGCTVGPNSFEVSHLAKGKRIVIFGLPGAFTPTCSAKHAPGYVAAHDRLRARKVDEVWCISVNDPFVMGAWARDQKADGKVRIVKADPSATRPAGTWVPAQTVSAPMVAPVAAAPVQPAAWAIVAGLFAGLTLSVALNTLVAPWSIGRLNDPVVLVAVSLVLFVAAMMAAAIPANRAASIQPVDALRTD